MKTRPTHSKQKCASAQTIGTAQAYPFGSEMPWDSTGQEEVYAWTKYFGYNDKAEVTLNAILGYDPADPALGIQRKRAPILGFHFRCKI